MAQFLPSALEAGWLFSVATSGSLAAKLAGAAEEPRQATEAKIEYK